MDYLRDVSAACGVELLAFIALSAVKATFLLAFVALLCLAFRRFSAAARHLLWTSALCAALLLPLLSFVKIWEVPILPASASIPDALVSNDFAASDQSPRMSEARNSQELPQSFEAINEAQKKSEFQTHAESFNALPPTAPETIESAASRQKNEASILLQIAKWSLAIWVVGAALFLFRLLIGSAAANLLARRAVEFKEPELNDLFSSVLAELDLKNKVRLLRSERTAMPIVCGILRPAVLLPAEAPSWSEERRRMVLLHELAHVARRDCLTQLLAQTACAFYWFNPFVWSAARRLRIEREQACDDYVLSVGTRPSDYAHHLLEIARSMQERSVFEWSRTTSVAMARRSQLEGRLLSILRKENKTRAMSRAATAGLVALIGFLVVSLAAIRPTVINARKSQSFGTTAKDENNKTEKSLLDSFLATGSEREGDAAIQSLETDKTARKQNDVPDEDSLAPAIDDKQIGKDIEKSPEPDLEKESAQNISKTDERQTVETSETPEIPQPPTETNPFINAEYEPGRKPQTQNKSGDFIDEMTSVGFTNLSVDELIMLKTHGVTADFVRGLRACGFDNLAPKTVANLRIYRVTPAYIEALASAGYKGLTVKELTSARIHNVTPEYVKAIQGAGYPSLSIKQMIQFKIYDITPELVRSARSRLGDLTPKQLVSIKISGILNEVGDRKKDKE